MHTRSNEHLKELISWRDETTLVPFSGVQFLDFGFSIAEIDAKPMRFVERSTSGDQGPERILIPYTGDEELDAEIDAAAKPDDDPYSIRPLAALEPFLEKWVPVPVLRLKPERGPGGEERYDPGPSSWARLRTVELAAPDPVTGHTHRVQLALDTAAAAQAQGSIYVAPELGDAENSREFRLVSDPARMDWFLRRLEPDEQGEMLDLQLWVSDWLKTMFLDFKRAERPGRRVSEETLPHQFEHWARYLAYLRTIQAACAPPKLRFVNTVSERDAVMPVDVDLVLDVGNSRTCGILIERFPGESRVDLARSYPLENPRSGAAGTAVFRALRKPRRVRRAPDGRRALRQPVGTAQRLPVALVRADRSRGPQPGAAGGGDGDRFGPVIAEALPLGRRSAAAGLAVPPSFRSEQPSQVRALGDAAPE